MNIEDTLFIIPARGGSKGLPRKNILPLNDKPLICYTIDAARGVTGDENICVSTDDFEIKMIVESYGIEVPFMRPQELATDQASSRDVIIHAFNYYKSKYKKFCLLQPTSPLRTSQDIYNAFEIFNKKKAKSVVSVCEVDHHPYWMNTLPIDHSMYMFEDPKYETIGRQGLPTFYRINGALYISDFVYYESGRSFLGKHSFAYIMDKLHSIDIDDEVDFAFAEYLLKKNI